MDYETFDFDLPLMSLPQPPYLVAGLGLAIGVLCGLTFARLIQNKLDAWKQDRLALLPLGSAEITISYSGVLVGTTLFIGACLLYTSPSPRDQRGSRMPSSA